MNRIKSLVVCACLPACLPAALPGCAGGDSTEGTAPAVALGAAAHGNRDEIVTLAECPEAVRATILAHAEGNEIREIERTADHGEILYEVDVESTAGVVEFDVAEDGAFRGYEQDDEQYETMAEGEGDRNEIDDDGEGDEEEILLADVPQHVKDAALAAIPGLVLEEAEREIEGDRLVYVLEGEADGTEYEIEVTAGGEVLEIEVEADDDADEDD